MSQCESSFREFSRVREIQVTKFEAFDGTQFDSADECEAYEGRNSWRRFANLSEAAVEAAFSGQDDDLASAFEKAGRQLANARLRRGVRRRAPRSGGDNDAQPPSPTGDGEDEISEAAAS
jgi:hypothetical protein